MLDSENSATDKEFEALIGDEPSVAADTTAEPAVAVTPEPTVKDLLDQVGSVQKAYADGRIEVLNLKSEIKALTDRLTEKAVDKGATPEEAAVETTALLEALLKNPKGMLTEQMKQLFPSLIEAHLKPYKEKLDKYEKRDADNDKNSQVDRFLKEHPDVTVEDERTLLNIIRTTPWISQMQGTVYDKIDAAFSKWVAGNPADYMARSVVKKDTSLDNAKRGAGVGNKGGKQSAVEEDEFDAVLRKDKASSSLWG